MQEHWRLTPEGYAERFSLRGGGSWKTAAHLHLLSEKVADLVNAGHGGGLIASIPIRHGKSWLLSHGAPLWFLDRWPGKHVGLGSYQSGVARKWGRRVRNSILYPPDGAPSLRVKVSLDHHSASDWETTQGGGMLTAGVGGPFTGHGFNLLLIDDPIKGRKEALSDVIRASTEEWLTDVALTRLEPDGVWVLLMSRWSYNDLSAFARSLDQKDLPGGRVEVIELPAEADVDEPPIPAEPKVLVPGITIPAGSVYPGRKKGEALWPARWPLAKLAEKKKNSRSWASLWQQRPMMEEGALFHRGWWQLQSAAPLKDRTGKALRWGRYWDMAATEKKPGEDPDWTRGCKGGFIDGVFYILGFASIRGRPMEVERLVRTTAVMDTWRSRIWIEEEPGSAGKGLVDHYRRYVLVGYTVEGDRVTGEKALRWEPLAAAAEAGNVVLVTGVGKDEPLPSWVEAFMLEAEQAPLGPHDDMLDAAAGLFNKTARVRAEIF